jgi:protoporphyrinogen oxidase
MGLACAHHLVKTGAKVTVLEAGPRMGGMSVTFDFNGLDIERFFHFICRTDYDYFALLDELGIRDALNW